MAEEGESQGWQQKSSQLELLLRNLTPHQLIPRNHPGSMSHLSTTPSLGSPVDPGPPSPGTAHEYDIDDIYVEDDILNDTTIPKDKVYDRKGKGKARQRSLSRTPRSSFRPLKIDPDVLDVAARQAYLSPPLTSSDSFLLGVHNISLALQKGLSSIDFDVDLDLRSGSERSSSPGGRSSSSTSGGEEEGELEAREEVVGTAVSELSLEESSILTPSATSKAESSRRATVGDTTDQDAGSVLPSVRFPSIFTHDMDYSSLESSRAGTPLSALLAEPGPILPLPDDLGRARRVDERGPVTKGILVHRRRSTVEVGVGSKRRRVLRPRRLKIQEKGLSELDCGFLSVPDQEL